MVEPSARADLIERFFIDRLGPMAGPHYDRILNFLPGSGLVWPDADFAGREKLARGNTVMSDASHMFLLEFSNALPPGFNFRDLLDEVTRADIPYRQHYSEYQSGGWWTCSLLGRSTDPTDGAVADTGRTVATDALDSLPAVRKLLEDLGLRYMMVRLARLEPGGALWEHRDYQDLDRVPRQRIHLPLETNPGALIVSGGRRYHMNSGSLQTFRPTVAHGACNAGNRARLHLMIDVYEDAHLKALLAGATPLASRAMPALSPAALADTVKCLRMTLANRHDGSDRTQQASRLAPWEQAVLGLYFAFSVAEGEIYEALEEACLENGQRERAEFWAARRRLTLGMGLVDA
jgi:hypothetical protein